MNLLRLPLSVIMMLAMMLGAYMLPQGARVGRFTQPMESLEICSEQAPGEDGLESRDPSAEHHQADDGGVLLSVAAEEETEGDDFLPSEQELSLLSDGRERSLSALPACSSHIIDLSRRPPRLS